MLLRPVRGEGLRSKCLEPLASSPQTGEKLFIKNLSTFLTVPHNYLETMYAMASNTASPTKKFTSDTNYLFEHYPALSNTIPYIKLGNLPTPISKLENLSKQLGITIYLKHDGLTGKLLDSDQRLFGGNKVRKLEFLLAEAVAHGAKTVLTFGYSGSNHVVATACYAKALGLKCIAMLRKQPNAHVVQRNLLLMHHYDTELHLCPDTEFRTIQTIATYIENKNNQSDFPYFMPTGGSVPVGILGFVNAVFELKKQIKEGLIPEPDYLYVAAGSFGTMAGLLLGLKAARLKTQLRPVLVEPIENPKALQEEIITLFKKTNRLLHDADSSFPLFDLTKNELCLNTDFTGSEYGLFIPEGNEAIATLQETEGIKLDGTYTAKAFAGLLDDVAKGAYKNKVVLFWNTFCSDDFDGILATQDYKQLPLCFHEFFEKEVQPLDR